MNTIKFYKRQFGKQCGFLNCPRKGFFLLPTREGMDKGVTFWVSCGHSHKVGA